MTVSPHTGAVAFGCVALAVYATAFTLGARLESLPHPAAMATAVTLDLTVLVPGAFHALVVRPRGWSPAALVAVVFGGMLFAARVLPDEQHGALRMVETVVLPAEGALLAWLAWRMARARRTAPPEGDVDPVARVYARVQDVMPGGAGRLVAAELAVLHYAFAAWRTAPHVPTGARAFTTTQRSGHGGLVFGLLLLTVVEGLAVHLLLAGWSTTIAWVVTALSAYGALWIVADYRATVLRPVLWTGTELWVRAGLRWQARVPQAQIRCVSRTALPAAERARSLAFLTEPNLWLACASPVVLSGPFGMRRETMQLGLFVDEPDRLTAALTEGAPDVARIASRGGGTP